MVRLTLREGDDHGAALRAACEALARGELVAFPTDTVYGLAVDARIEGAVEAVYQAKGRPADKALPLLVADMTMALELVHDPEGKVLRLARRFWPGPLTIVAPATEVVPVCLVPEDGTTALRMPDHDLALTLISRYGTPLATTSANPSGRPSLRDADAVVEALGDYLAVLLDAPCGAHPQPSTVVSIRDAEPRVLRVGAVSEAAIREALG